MQNRELIYELCLRLNMIMSVEKDGVLVGRFVYVDGKLCKKV